MKALTLRHIIGRPVCSGDGAALGSVMDVVFTPAPPPDPAWTNGNDADAVAAMPGAEAGLLAFAVVEVGVFLGVARHRVALQVTGLEWNASGNAIIVPKPAACLRARLPAMAAC